MRLDMRKYQTHDKFVTGDVTKQSVKSMHDVFYNPSLIKIVIDLQAREAATIYSIVRNLPCWINYFDGRISVRLSA